MKPNLVENAAGRLVPNEINGRPAVPFQGVGKYRPEGHKAGLPIRSCADYPADGNKTVADLATALKSAGLRDGMTLSTHHHFRNGVTGLSGCSALPGSIRSMPTTSSSRRTTLPTSSVFPGRSTGTTLTRSS